MSIPNDDALLRERPLSSAAMIGSLERYRIIDKKELRRYVPYSSHHIGRLEADGAFPVRLRLGANRVGWLLGEVLDWIDARKNARRGQAPASQKSAPFAVPDSELNCIIDKRALRRFVPYTSQHIARLEPLALFPVRIPVGGNRVGWVLGEVLDWIAALVRERDARLRAQAERRSFAR